MEALSTVLDDNGRISKSAPFVCLDGRNGTVEVQVVYFLVLDGCLV